MPAPGVVDVTYTIEGLDDFERLMRKSLPDIGSDQRVYLNALKQAAQRSTIPRARANYRGLGGSGSLAMAMRAYRWKAGTRKNHFTIHAGPKRSIRRALLRWLAYYKKVARPRTFTYGIRHAHLVEFGHKIRNRRGGPVLGQVPGKHVLQRSGAATRKQFTREFTNSWGDVIDREVRRLARKRTRKKIK